MSIADATLEALRLLLSADKALWKIIGVSLSVSLLALLLATPLSLLLAYALSIYHFAARRLLISLLQGMLSFPTVVVGLMLYMLLSRQGPLGAWGILFTPQAMILGQIIIAFPILTVFALSALQKNDSRLLETLYTMDVSFWRRLGWLLVEARFGLIAALLAGFGRVISEVGCALMVGGNIAHWTRNITTAIALETSKGLFAEGIALGIVLVLLALSASILLAIAQGSGR